MSDHDPHLIVRYKGGSIWRLLGLAVFGVAFVFVAFKVTNAELDEPGAFCPKIGCFIVGIFFDLVPAMLKRFVFLILGLFFAVLAVCGFVASILRLRPIALIIDETGVARHRLGRPVTQLRWGEISKVLVRKEYIMITGRQSKKKDRTITLLPIQLDVSSEAILDLIDRHRPDLQVTGNRMNLV